MRSLKRAAWATLSAAALIGCGADAPPTSDVTRTLLAQPRAADLSTEIDGPMPTMTEANLDVDLLGVNMGSPDAPVKVIEFVDFGCGYCRQFHVETFPTLRREFIDTQMIEWKFMSFVSGMFPNSDVMTEAAECSLAQAGALFAGFTDRVWVQQADWKRSDDAEGLARTWTSGLGADPEAFDACMKDDTRLERVSNATALAGELGVRATPTFWIIGVGPIQGSLPLEAFREIFTQIHAELSQSAG